MFPKAVFPMSSETHHKKTWSSFGEHPALQTCYSYQTFWVGHTETSRGQQTSSVSLKQTVQYSTVQYSTVQYSIVQYSTVQYSTVQYNQSVID